MRDDHHDKSAAPVISIGKVTDGGAAVEYFEEALKQAKGEPLHRYLASGRSPAHWYGRGAAALGLRGAVEREQLVRILDASDPSTGEALGTRHGTRKNLAYDVTYSVPKSVSLLWALGDAHVRTAVMEALHAGADAAHEYLERHAAWGRVVDPATKQVEAVRAELVTAAFTHRTARPVTHGGRQTVDPQLHVHLLVSSAVRRANGTWGQLHSPALYTHAAAAGAIGQAATRDVLVSLLGVRVRTNANGTFEIDGFTPEQLAEFSQRHRQVLAAAAAAGATSLHGTKVAVLDTREAKSEPDDARLVADWHERAAPLGLTREHIAGLLDQEQVRTMRWFDVETVEQVVGRGEGGLTAQASVFSRREVIRSLAAHAPLGMQRDALEGLADAILAERSVVVPMIPDHPAGLSDNEAVRQWVERGFEIHYSTREVVGLEQRTLESVWSRQQEGTVVLPLDAVERAVRRAATPLTPGQRAMVDAVCLSAAGVVIVEGAAGTGKTTGARVIRDACIAQRVPIVGCAVSNRATVELQEEAGIPSFSTASLLHQLTAMGRRLQRGSIIVADECSMMGPGLAELVLVAQRDGAKLAVLGDHRQLQPIDGGALFRSLGDRIGRVELTEVVRQTEAWDRAVLLALRRGQPEPLVKRYLEDGRVRTLKDEPARIAAMAADWVSATCDGHDVLTIARERHVVAALNTVTRAAAIEAGLVHPRGVRRHCLDHLGNTPVDLGELEFAVGDRVLLVGQTIRRCGLVKGARGSVVRVDGDGTLVVAPRKGGRHLTVPPEYTGVTHGYALTAHRAIGATADMGLVHGSDGADTQWHYVALSRHRIRAIYYDVERPRDPEGVHHEDVEPRALEERLVLAMARDGSKATTLDYPREYDRQLLHAHAAADPRGGPSGAPTEKQLDILRDRGRLQDLPRVATWVHASVLIDMAQGASVGDPARQWLMQSGASAEDAGRIVALAVRDVRASAHTSDDTPQRAKTRPVVTPTNERRREQAIHRARRNRNASYDRTP